MHVPRCSLVAAPVLLFASLPAAAATLCVAASGAGCYHHISDAVKAAAAGDTIVVVEGTYREQVTITRPLSLTALNATIDASGQFNGILVDGLNNTGLSGVHVSNFTIKNAKHEGVLVLNASYVSVSGMTVKNNNKSLAGGNCPDKPTYEPGEGQDCGEGIHLQGADHSIVTQNEIFGNSGGILVSDDSGATHDNLISFNNVHDNPYACGITLASHPVAPETGAAAPFGVYHNTVYGNRSLRNGAEAGGGAGLGIFASVPGAKTYGNVVIANLAKDNGHPGVSMHSHAPGQMLSDNMVVGNTLVGNGIDATNTASTGPTGISLTTAVPTSNASGNMFASNSIQQADVDVAIDNPQPVTVQFNSLLGGKVGVANTGLSRVDATNDWWGCIFGPGGGGGCATSTGAVTSMPWLIAPPDVKSNY